ncbi:periplasmic binding protein-like II [Anaeromyces robustus]|uniref:Periplasmic binding protein-like II n=1 Tax=Anaeromyces robustus TaxID=1754192 RepID=A0A1Y1VVZ7_9FUNG|nr:periplasmic binding protein-like II [Anaeromyces robustus]|eukprot:ORX65467.1 periplasmic binding protein-like II [Anaeromyces robustus]
MNNKTVLSFVLLAFSIIGGRALSTDNSDKELKFGFDTETEPFTYLDNNNNVAGFDAELANEVVKKAGWTLNEIPVAWEDKTDKLNDGTIDCFWSCFTIDGRENDYTWTEPYIKNKQVVVVKSNDIKSLDDLKEKIVEALKDCSSVKALKGTKKDLGDTFKELKEISDYSIAFNDLKSGSCDAVIADLPVAKVQVSKNSEFKIIEEEIISENLGVAFKKGNTEVRDKVQKVLDELINDGTVAKIAEKYSEYGLPDLMVSNQKEGDNSGAIKFSQNKVVSILLAFIVSLLYVIILVKARFTDEINYKIYKEIEKNPLCGITPCDDHNTVCGIGFNSLPIFIKGEDCELRDPIANYYETFRKETDDNEDRVGIDVIAYCPSGQYNMAIFGVQNKNRSYCVNDKGDHVSFEGFYYQSDKESGKINFGDHSILKTLIVFKYYGIFGISCTKTWDLYITINDKVGCTPEE